MRITLRRITHDPDGTPGALYADNKWGVPKFVCFCFERPWLGNERDVSCIGQGYIHPLVWTDSPKFGRRLEVQECPGRSHILIHSGNYQRDTKGCIIPVTKLDKTGGGDSPGWGGWKSGEALKKLEAHVPDDGSAHTFVIEGPDLWRG